MSSQHLPDLILQITHTNGFLLRPSLQGVAKTVWRSGYA